MPALGIRITAPSTVPSVVLDGVAADLATHNAAYLVSNQWAYDWETSP